MEAECMDYLGIPQNQCRVTGIEFLFVEMASGGFLVVMVMYCMGYMGKSHSDGSLPDRLKRKLRRLLSKKSHTIREEERPLIYHV